MKPEELGPEDEAWYFKLSCLFWECRKCVTVRQVSETDGLFVFSCLCSPSRTTLILTVSAEMYTLFVERHAHIAVGMCTTWTLLNLHSRAASHFSLIEADGGTYLTLAASG